MKRGLFHASRRLLLRPCHHYRSQGRYALTMLSASTKRLTTSSSSPSAPNAPVSAITTAAPTGMTSSPVAFPPELEAAIRKVEVLGGKEALIPLEVREALARKWEVFITERSRPIDSRTQFVGNFVLILYVKSKDPVKVEEGIELMKKLRNAGVPGIPSIGVSNEIIRACGREIRALNDLSPDCPHPKVARWLGRAEYTFEHICSHIKKSPSGWTSRYRDSLRMVFNSMIYLECSMGRRLGKGKELIDKMLELGLKPDKWSCSGLIKATAQIQGRPLEALWLLKELEAKNLELFAIPTLYYTIMASAVSNIDNLYRTARSNPNFKRECEVLVSCLEETYSKLKENGEHDWKTLLKLMEGYASMGNITKFEEVMPKLGPKRTPLQPQKLAQYAVYIKGLSRAGEKGKLLEFLEMLREGGLHYRTLNAEIYMSAIVAFCELRDTATAKLLYQEWKRARHRNDKSYMIQWITNVIRALLDAGLHREAWEVFQDAEKGAFGDWDGKLNRRFYTLALRIAPVVGGTELMQETFDKFLKSGQDPDVMLYNSLLAGYAEKGEFDEANTIFLSLKERGIEPDLPIFNTMINAAVKGNRPDSVAELIEDMKQRGMTLNSVTMRTILQDTSKFALPLQELLNEQLAPLHEGYIQRRGSSGSSSSSNSKESVEKEGEDHEELSGNGIVIDLHGATVNEAYSLLSREFNRIREQSEKGLEIPESLVVITGVGRRSFLPGHSVLRSAVREFLRAREVNWYHPQGNRGRYAIPKVAFVKYITRREAKDSRGRFLRSIAYRFIPVTSLLLLLLVMPDLQGHII